MSPIRLETIHQPKPSQVAKETRPMSANLFRFLDLGASILIVVLATVTAGATAALGA
jgi:ABC-type nitrate/sulfonate/bicarbonate transport system permease component